MKYILAGVLFLTHCLYAAESKIESAGVHKPAFTFFCLTCPNFFTVEGLRKGSHENVPSFLEILERYGRDIELMVDNRSTSPIIVKITGYNAGQFLKIEPGSQAVATLAINKNIPVEVYRDGRYDEKGRFSFSETNKGDVTVLTIGEEISDFIDDEILAISLQKKCTI